MHPLVFLISEFESSIFWLHFFLFSPELFPTLTIYSSCKMINSYIQFLYLCESSAFIACSFAAVTAKFVIQ